MVLHKAIYWLLVFFIQDLRTDDECMVWDILGDNLMFSCTITDFSNPVTLFDNQNKTSAKCSFEKDKNQTIRCAQQIHNVVLGVNVKKKEVMFTIPNIKSKYVDGAWSCLQGLRTSTCNVSKLKGIVIDTDIFLQGELRKINKASQISLLCSSCRESRGNHVEFLINGRTEISVTYNPVRGKCTHQTGECSPEKCYCEPAKNEFIAAFSFSADTETIFSCEMQFIDEATSMLFSKTANICFNGTDIQVMNTDTNILIHPKAPNTDTDVQTENVTNRSTIQDGTDEIDNGVVTRLVLISSLSIMLLVVLITVLFLFLRQQQRKGHKELQLDKTTELYQQIELENQQLEEERHLLDDSVPVCVIASYTSMTNEDRLYLGCQNQGTMTKDSYLHDLEAENNDKKIEAEIQTRIEAKIKSGESTRCYPCSVLNKLIEGQYWCLDCGSSLCFLCNKIHQVMSSHSIVDIQKLPMNYAVSFFCSQHTQSRLDYFCINQDKLCCLECIDAHQPKCKKTEHIDVVSKSYGQSHVYKDYEDQLDFGSGLVTTINVRLLRNIESIENECHQIEEVIARMKYESVENENVFKLNTELTEKKAKCLSTLQNYISEAEILEASTVEQKKMFEFFKQNGSDKLLFALIIYSKQTLFTRNTKIQHLLEDINRLSILYIECGEENPDAERIKIVKRKHEVLKLPDQYQIETNMQIRIGPAVISFVGDLEIKGAKTPGSMVVSKDGLLLVCDAIHSAILVVAENRQTEVSIILRYPPRDISLIPDMDTAVLTCQSDHIIQFVDIRQQTVLSKEEVEGSADCSLVCTEEYILIGGKMKIIVLDHEGKYITNIETDSVLRHLSYFNKRIYFTEYGSNNVRCIEMNGYKVVNVFCHQSKDVAAPICVAPNKEGHVYILDRGPIKIHKLSAYGHKIKLEIKGNSDLMNPRAMCFSKDYTRLYVLNKGGSRISTFEV